MSDLVAFLRARLDEDEQQATLARMRRDWDPKTDERPVGPSAGQWSAEGEEVSGDGILIVEQEGWHNAEQANHIARWDPARVLAEVQAKRAIVDRYEDERSRRDAYRSPLAREAEDHKAVHDRRTQEARSRVAEDVVRLLALPYVDHLEYRQEWTA